MATNKVQTGKVKSYAHSSAVTSGEAIIIGKRIAVALGNYEADELGAYDTEGVYTLPKTNASDVIADGVEVYLTPAGNVSLSNSGNTSAGCAFAASAAGVTTVDVKING